MLAGLLASKYSQKRVDSRGHFIMDYSSIALWIAIENLLTYGSLFKYWFGNALGVVWELFGSCLEGVQCRWQIVQGKFGDFLLTVRTFERQKLTPNNFCGQSSNQQSAMGIIHAFPKIICYIIYY